MDDLILNFELIPRTCWNKNLRTTMKKSEWDRIRKNAYQKADGHCMLCGTECDHLEAHERWEYDEENHIQRLTDVIAVCQQCHSVIHIGRTQMIGYEQQAKEHFINVNMVERIDYQIAVMEAKAAYDRRSKIIDWNLNISWLEKQDIYINK